MPSTVPLPRPRRGILEIEPYVPGSSGAPGPKSPVKLSSNESPLGPSPEARAAYDAAPATLEAYPDGGAGALREAIAAAHGLEPARVVCGNGSDELLSLLATAYTGPGDKVVTTHPAFLIYEIATKTAGADIDCVPLRADAPDVDALLEAVDGRTRLVYLANPGNPTGTCLGRAEIERLHAGLPGDCLLVLDGAYAEYVTRGDYTAGEGLVRAHGNVVMTRTFSKIYGLAGLRLGWAYCPEAVADVLNRIRGPFNTSTPAQAAGIAALADRAHIAAARDHNARWRDRLTGSLRQLGLGVPESEANFVLMRFPGGPDRAAAADAHLREAGYVLRHLSGYAMPDCLRLSVGTDAAMEGVLDALTAFATDGGV